jgi:RimJ/RimL family protein N-acetyltransferase
MDFDFTEDYILENERALLRPLVESDFENLIPFSKNEPEIWMFSLISGAGEKGLKNYINQAMEGRKAQKDYPFIVFDKLTNQWAGSSRFYDIQVSNSNLQLGYTWYGKQFQGTGLNAHCKFLMLSLAFEKIGMERVEFRADNDNKKSIAAMKKIGCVEEGILRSNGYTNDGNRRDSIVLSILKSEWMTYTKEMLKKQLY